MLERGRTSTRRSARKSRSKSSNSDKKKVYFGDSEEDQPNPNFTIYKEGGVGYTKYTVYTKNRGTQPETAAPMQRQASLPRERRKPSMEQFISSYKEKPQGYQAVPGSGPFVPFVRPDRSRQVSRGGGSMVLSIILSCGR